MAGRYEVSADNVLTLGTQSAAWNNGHPERVDTNAAITTDSYRSCKLRVNGDHIAVDFYQSGEVPETWYSQSSVGGYRKAASTLSWKQG